MKESNTKLKEIRLTINPNKIINIIPYVRNYAVLVNNIQHNRGIKEIIQKIDSKKNVIEAIMQLFGKNHIIIDLESRDIFKAGVIRSTLKCIIGYNYYGKCHEIINLNTTYSKCSRYNKEETQEYIIQYELLMENNKTFFYILDIKLNKILKTNNDNAVKESVLRNIREFLIGQDRNFETAQSFIRQKYTFYRHVMKKWTG